MGLAIRLPIGLMFSILGLLLAGFGMLGDPSIYRRSLGININLWWGIVMLAFGIIMLLLGMRRARSTPTASDEGSGPGPRMQ